ncbi:endonuclease MutS2 [Paenibacillus albicereus]|uniref:Endonuclease MutS2 n=1 Tax=Paenibacillus albicereus TaxID=2726185 RepID=A0A6H2GVD2_9BACL|nr:endonuclease MutS2 [Paenibacillus albicereus]QJC51355.1 endonuclease MutS2 [Paenibacillus albicereus]
MDSKILSTLEYSKIIHQLIQHTATPMGLRMAEELAPSSALDDVVRSLQATVEAANAYRLKGNPPFRGVADIRAHLKRAAIGGTLSPGELLEVALTARGARRVRSHVLHLHDEQPMPLLAHLAEGMYPRRELEDDIFACIDESGEVLDGASVELGRIRRELRQGEGRVREKLEQMLRSSSVQKMLQDTLVTLRGDRYVIPVKQEYRSHFGGIVHDQSNSGATLFIEPEAVVALNNKLREVKAAEAREIERILQKLTALAAEAAEDLAINHDGLAQLDFAFAKAQLAHAMKAELPLMNDEGRIVLKRGFHPLLDRSKAVPLHLELGASHTGIIVTGPNTGGKTVALKTVGLLSLMAMSGLFVPADDGTELCVFDAIYADIGDEQSIEQSLSTFSSHMTNIIRILRDMTPSSLVLLDELGAGTDPAEGSALAIAILDHIHRMGCRLLATTHYSELKAYAYNRPGLINASMEFDVATLSPTYRLLVGVPGRSNAFAIAERLGLDKAIIQQARGEVSEEDLRVENMIESLERDRQSAEQERDSAERLRRELEDERSLYEEELRRFEEQRERLLAKAQEEARQAVQKARREADEIIQELRQLQREEGAAVKDHKLTEARKRLEKASPQLVQGRQGARPAAEREIEAGDEVKVHSLGQRGHVVERSGSEATVQLGILKMKVKLADLELLKPAPAPKAAPKAAPATLKRTRDDNVKMELDLRGSNLDESIIEVDRFLDESFLAGMGQVYIIHGKGTGVLRAGIQDFLRRHSHVKSYRLGNYGEGGAGVTVAELK